jgi:hypothetical protein
VIDMPPSRAGTATSVFTAATIAIIAIAAGIEYWMGRVPWCTCGHVKLWHGVVHSSENSQHLTDWYTLSHVVHGVGFYMILWTTARRLPVGARFVLAVLIEAAWEVFENTPFVIERYRAATISLQYYGDSIINSMSDIVAMMAGFWIARRATVWTSAGLVVALEAFAAIMIRDNLALNILMLVYPLDVIKRWQMGG